MKIEIKSIYQTILFTHEVEDNSIRKTAEEAITRKIYLGGANLRDANLGGANLGDANLGDANLGDANLGGANLRGANLGGANLGGANLGGANLGVANLRGANLRGANLGGANLGGANLRGANLGGANLRGANLRGADLGDADLGDADLGDANLGDANLRGANLGGADLRGANLGDADLGDADLRGANLKKLPVSYVNQCSRDMLFIFQSLPSELPFLRERLIAGEVDGSQYEGKCACLIGTLANADGGVDKVCETIPFYDKGLHNYSEQWFWQIKRGDTPETNAFAAHALKLVDIVLAKLGK